VRSFDPVRNEHTNLLPHIDALLGAAEAVDLPGHSAFELIDDAWRFLTDHLTVHAMLEEQVLYPALTDALGAPEAVRLLNMDHRDIVGLIEELRTLRRALADHDVVEPHLKRELRRVLFGLHALIRSHFAKEEEVVLPLLEARTTPADAERLVRALGHHHATA
jgi:iron-sulfur cluster repair protein YtfE (RIC family)